MDAGKVEPITGTVAFLTDSPNPVVLGEVNLNKNGQAVTLDEHAEERRSLPDRGRVLARQQLLRREHLGAHSRDDHSQTVNAPTVTSLQAVTNSIETGESIALNATVQNTNSSLADGVVEFVTVARHPVVLGEVDVGTFGQQVSFTTSALKKVGTYQIEAEYLPNTNRFAESTSPPVTVTVTPLTAASFRVTPVVRHGHLGKP